jgi:hypothetical protein
MRDCLGSVGRGVDTLSTIYGDVLERSIEYMKTIHEVGITACSVLETDGRFPWKSPA